MGLMSTLFFVAFAAALGAAPKLELKDCGSTVDFGKYPAKDGRSAVFRIANTGDEPLKILSVRMTCGCFAAEGNPDEIAPGKTEEFKFLVKPDSIHGPFRKNIYVETDDPGTKFTTLTMGGEAMPAAAVKPSALVNAGTLMPGKPFSQDFVVEALMDGVKFGKPRIMSNYPAEIEATEQKEKAKDFAFRLKIAPEKAGDNLKCVVSVPIAEPEGWNPVEITVVSKVGLGLFAVPSTLFLKPGADGGAEARFVLRTQAGKAFALEPGKLGWNRADGADFLPGGSTDGGLEVKAVFSGGFLNALPKDGASFSFTHPGISSPAEVKVNILRIRTE